MMWLLCEVCYNPARSGGWDPLIPVRTDNVTLFYHLACWLNREPFLGVGA